MRGKREEGRGAGEIDLRIAKSIKNLSAAALKKDLAKILSFLKIRNQKLSVYITDNKEIRRINKKFLKHDYATDVISFPHKDRKLLGDIVVSAQMAASFAKELRISFEEELYRYLVHGVLHLLGYDDHRLVDKKKMFKTQEKIVRCLLLKRKLLF